MSVANLPVIDRIPPQNLDAEMALIGSVLVDREIMGAVSEIVSPPDFYAHVHETIFAVLADLYQRGWPLDKISVAEELKRRDQLENVGGLPYLTSLMDTVQTAASAAYYATIVREKSLLRSLIHAGTQITQDSVGILRATSAICSRVFATSSLIFWPATPGECDQQPPSSTVRAVLGAPGSGCGVGEG